jgi:hypothetical protein
MPVTYYVDWLPGEGDFEVPGGTITFTVDIGPPGSAGPNTVSDTTALGTLTAVTNPLFLLGANAAGTFVRRVTPGSGTGGGLSLLLAADRAAVLALLGTGTPGSGNVLRGNGSWSAPLAIGDTVTGATAGQAMYVGPGGVLADALTGALTLPRQVSSTSVSGFFPLQINRDAGLGGGIAFRVGPDGQVDVGSTINTATGIRATAFGAYMGVLAGSRFEFQNGRIDAFTTLSLQTLRSVPLAVALSANQNNWNPGTATFLDITTSGGLALDVTGVGVSQVDGQILYVRKVGGTPDVRLLHESASSTAANRFTCETKTTIVIPTGAYVMLVYSSSRSRWDAYPSRTCT